MKRFWPELAVLTLGLLLATAVFADPQVGCQNGRCAVRPVPYSPAVATSPALASPAVAGFAPADGACGESPAVASQDWFPVLKKLFRRVSHPLGGRFRR